MSLRFTVAFVALSCTTVYAVDDQLMLNPQAGVGQQWRRATLPDDIQPVGNPLPKPDSVKSDEVTLSPIWDRLRVLVKNSSKPALADQMTPENLRKLIANGRGFDPVANSTNSEDKDLRDPSQEAMGGKKK